MERISAVIIAGAEENNISDCLQSVRFADEIIVVNSGSRDRTVEIAQSFTDRVYVHAWEGYAAQKSYAVSLATNEWVLSIDADERVSSELRDEIKSLNFESADGFFIPRRNFFIDRVIRSCGWFPDYQMRLFRKSKTSVTDRRVHEGFMVNGKTGRLSGELIHFTHMTIENTMRKSNEFSSLSAEEKASRRRVKGRHIFFYPLYAFFHHYILRRGFTEGVHGLMVSMIHAVTNLQTQMKIWEIQNIKNKEQKKPE